MIVLFLLVVVVTSYFLIPLFLDRTYLNNDNLPQITYDSFGHSAVLTGLAKGYVFDFGRFPSLTILMAVGFVICLFRWRQERYLIPVAIFLLWLLLFFGRSTWGVLMKQVECDGEKEHADDYATLEVPKMPRGRCEITFPGACAGHRHQKYSLIISLEVGHIVSV